MTAARTVTCALIAAFALASTVDVAEARPRPRRGKKFQANKGFGLGLMIGAPSGLSGKYFYAADKAFDFGIGGIRYYRNRSGLHLHADHLWHPVSLVSNADFELPLYLGVGVRVFDFNDDNNKGDAIGLRVPVGLAFDLNKTPIDIFVELAFVADFFVNYTDDFGTDLSGAIGFRYYFN
ncbi:MAG: hypothetical protein R3B06_31180 [Kofleriaceae bacterium]